MSCPIIAFYGFKGGAGRSFLLASTAALLMASGKRVLVMDADLEAPGLGDFFDDAGDTKRGVQGILGDAWRHKKGYIDLLTEEANPEAEIACGQSAELRRTREVAENIARKLRLTEGGTLTETSAEYLTLIEPPDRPGSDNSYEMAGRGRLVLFGPGSHQEDQHLGGLKYISNLLNLDIGARLADRQGRTAIDGLKLALSEMAGFDYVLIDGRTGYNANSIVTIQNLASSVVMVSTPALQSIEGMARVSTLFTGLNPSQPMIKPRLALLRTSGARPKAADRNRREVALLNKRKVVENYFHHLAGDEIHEFPIVDDFATGESFMFRRDGIRETLFPSGLPLSDEEVCHVRPTMARGEVSLRGYCRELVNFVSGLTGETATSAQASNADDRILWRAFELWRRNERKLDEQHSSASKPSVAQDFDGASNSTEVLLEQSRAFVERFLEQARAFLQPLSDRPGEGVSRGGRETGSLVAEDSFEHLERAYASLYLEERTLASTKLDQRMRADMADGGTWSLRHERLKKRFLSTLPNGGRIATHAPWEPFETQDPERTDRTARSNGSPTWENFAFARLMSDLCRDVALIDNEDRPQVTQRVEKLRKNAPAGRAAEIADILLFHTTDVQEVDHTKYIEILTRFRVIVADPDQGYLPKTAELLQGTREWNLIDVVERRLHYLNGNGLPPELTDAVTKAARVVTAHFAQNLPNTDVDFQDVGRAAQYMSDWLLLWARAAVLGFKVGTAGPGYPDAEELEKIRSFVGIALKLKGLEPTHQISLLRLQGYCGLIGGDAASAHHAQDRILEVIADELDKKGPRIARDVLEKSISLCYILDRHADAWRLQRYLQGEPGREGAPIEIDLTASATAVGLRLGIPFPVPVTALPFASVPMPDLDENGRLKVIQWLDTSEHEDRALTDNMGWYVFVSMFQSGRYQDVMVGLSPTDDSELRTRDAGSWTIAARMELGLFEGLEDDFDTFATSKGNARTFRDGGANTYLASSNILLRAALAQGDTAAFDRFDERVTVDALTHWAPNFEARKVTREVLRLKRTSMEADSDLAVISKRAKILRKKLVEAFRASFSSPADRNFADIFGREWDGLGEFSGNEFANPKRADIASSLLDVLELETTPDLTMFDLVERLLWTKGRGVEDDFLAPIELSLLLPRARLEVLRSRHEGLDADCDGARDWMERDLAVNGDGRKVHYPEDLRPSRV
ncbi:KGGVGR-motif variant AAA ATPase [Alloyangia pacifica]|uniref:KGGVGR-motif variant AAA ATPase n=1 Tax=Alloyangia pacifica TaxID=311180 RepID=UPI001CFE0FDD|nr:hypothetical protein [Alloyangia pacifica]